MKHRKFSLFRDKNFKQITNVKLSSETKKEIITYLLLLSLVVIGIISLLLLTRTLAIYDRIKINGKKVYVPINLADFVIHKNLLIALFISTTISIFSLLFFKKNSSLCREVFLNTIVGVSLIILLVFLFGFYKPNYNKTIVSLLGISICILCGYIFYSYFSIFYQKQERVSLFSVRQLTESSVLVGVTVLLSFLADLVMPKFPSFMGGFRLSITYLPLMIIALRCGPLYCGISGLVYGTFNMFLDGGFVHIGSLFLDYLLPYSFFAVMGILQKFTNKSIKKSFPIILGLATITSFFIYLFHSLSGVLYFGEYAPAGVNKYLYSFVYVNLPAVSLKMTLSLIYLAYLFNPLISKEKRVV